MKTAGLIVLVAMAIPILGQERQDTTGMGKNGYPLIKQDTSTIWQDTTRYDTTGRQRDFFRDDSTGVYKVKPPTREMRLDSTKRLHLKRQANSPVKPLSAPIDTSMRR